MPRLTIINFYLGARMQVSTLAPPSHLHEKYHRYFDKETRDLTKATKNSLREKLRMEPDALVEVLIAGACDPNWIDQTGNLLKRLFKDTSKLILANRIPMQTAARIKAVFCEVTSPQKALQIHRDITIVQNDKKFEASRTILMGYSDFFHGYFCSGLKESQNQDTTIQKDNIAKFVSFEAFQALYRYMETKNCNDLESLKELDDLWDLVRLCDMWRSSVLKKVIERILIKKTGPLEAYESLQGVHMFGLNDLGEHCSQTISTAQFRFHSREDHLTATIKKGFRLRDIEKVARGSDHLTSISLEDKSFNQKIVTDLVEKLPNLDSVTIAISTTGISTEARKVIGSKIKVRSLKINPTFKKEPSSELTDEKVEISGLDHIQSLDLRKLPQNYRRFAMGLILKLGPQLLDIRLSTLTWVDDKFITGMCCGANSLPLQLLDLGYCKVTDKTAATLAEKFSNLVVLNISGTQITCEGLINILLNCTKITDLNLGSLNITSLIARVPQLFEKLTSLKLTGKACSKEDFQVLFRNAVKLQTLNVDRCENFNMLLLEGFQKQLCTLTVNESAFSIKQDLPSGFFLSLNSLTKLTVLGKPDSIKKSLILAQAKVKQDLEVEFIEDKL